MKKHNYELIKKVNIGCLILLITVFISRFVNSNSFAEIFGVSNKSLNIPSIMYFLGYNIYWILPLIVIVRNFIIIKNINHSKHLYSYQKQVGKNTNSKDTRIDNIMIKEKKTIFEDNSKNQKSSYALPIIIIFLICSISFNVMFLIKYFQTNDELLGLKQENRDIKYDLYNIKSELTDILGLESKDYVKRKLNYMDNKIKFRIDGYDGYYFSYDCMIMMSDYYDDLRGDIILVENAKKKYKEYICK